MSLGESLVTQRPQKDRRRAMCCMILCPLFLPTRASEQGNVIGSVRVYLQEEVGNTTGNDIVYCDLLN